MPKRPKTPSLSRREREIMDIVYRRGRAAAADVLADLDDPPGYSTVRTLLKILEDKGHLKHERSGTRFVYLPTVSRERAQRSALQRLMQTFFDGSAEKAMAAMLDISTRKLSDEQLDRLAQLIDDAKQRNPS
jgi:predicted transcriptional regulator